jgi:hypothetical protein
LKKNQQYLKLPKAKKPNFFIFEEQKLICRYLEKLRGIISNINTTDLNFMFNLKTIPIIGTSMAMIIW